MTVNTRTGSSISYEQLNLQREQRNTARSASTDAIQKIAALGQEQSVASEVPQIKTASKTDRVEISAQARAYQQNAESEQAVAAQQSGTQATRSSQAQQAELKPNTNTKMTESIEQSKQAEMPDAPKAIQFAKEIKAYEQIQQSAKQPNPSVQANAAYSAVA